ncbi:MAG: phosphonate ABC transporter ATP-binding protein, partial [Anaerolineae bacterium]
KITQEDGITVMVSLHFLDLVQQYSDHVIALNDGELVFQGDPAEIDDARFKDIYGKDAERIG